MILKFKKLSSEAKTPTMGTKGAACFDLYAIEDTFLPKGDPTAIRTGLAFEVPKGYCMTVYSRSSSFAKRGLTIVPLIVDSDYRGEVMVFVRYDGAFPLYHIVKKGERVAQFKLERLEDTELTEVQELTDTERGTGGYGSTGK